MRGPLAIWSNAFLPERAATQLRDGAGKHRLIVSERSTGNLAAGGADPAFLEADVAFGQPDPAQVLEAPKLKWFHLTSAGYTRYDTPEIREGLRRRNIVMTNSSMVFDQPCAQHALAFMLAIARQLPMAMVNQVRRRAWNSRDIRAKSRLLNGQRVLILGYGSIARQLVRLLTPFEMQITGIRRRPRGDEQVPTYSDREIDRLLPEADHVVNILPTSAETVGMIDARRFGLMKTDAVFYNIGRGNTVDQAALLAALESGKLRGAYLDVTEPEPLPMDHPLWSAPNCHITPHTAGGSDDEHAHLVAHFLDNLGRYERGEQLLDRVI